MNTHTPDPTLPDPTLPGTTPAELTDALRWLDEDQRPRHRRLWTYYRNPMSPAVLLGPDVNAAERPYRLGQEWGLPARITGYVAGQTTASASRAGSIQRKEVVCENDIGWRVDTMVDYLFGKELVLESVADDPARSLVLTRLVRAILAANGGLATLQQLATLGAVFGFVDVVVKLDTAAATALKAELGDHDAWPRLITHNTPNKSRAVSTAPAQEAPTGSATDSTSPGEEGRPAPVSSAATDDLEPTDTGPGITPDGRLIERLARLVRFEVVHPSRALPLPRDAEIPTAYAQVWEDRPPAPAASSTHADARRWWERALGVRRSPHASDAADLVGPGNRQIELLTPGRWVRLSGGRVVASGEMSLAELPLVHIQNVATAFEYAGRSDVEPLIPLQDELNTRLSDRAYRITMTSFKMFLAKGIDNFLSLPIGPGRMFSTDNDTAEIDEFGGDERCPSEEQHISDLRDALDKASAVPPVAAGAIKDRLGQLSSAAALRVTLQSLLAKTERKRAT